jgi:hypothetical protein
MLSNQSGPGSAKQITVPGAVAAGFHARGVKGRDMKAAIIYWSHIGNTEKVAQAIKEGLKAAGIKVSLKRVKESADVDFYGYDLICLGFPSYRWSPPKPVDEFLKTKFAEYRDPLLTTLQVERRYCE